MRISKRVKREANQLFRLCLLNGLLDSDRMRHVVGQVIMAQRRSCPAVLAHLLRLVRLDCAQHTATVESAIPLPPDLQASTQVSLTRLYGPGIITSFAHRPALIGGLRVQVGSDVYDGSVLAGLAALEKSF